MRRLAILCVGLPALAMLAGCQPPVRTVGPVDQITMFVATTPVFLDAEPGPDGVRVSSLYFFQESHPEPVAVNGTLEFLLFEGVVSSSRVLSSKPMHVWTFSGNDLAPHMGRDRLGVKYSFVLPWGQVVPTAETVTLAARYQPTGGAWVHAAPVSVVLTGD